MADVEPPLRGELRVGVGHDAARDAEIVGQAARRGEPRAGVEAAIADRGAQPVGELLAERPARTRERHGER